LRKLVQFRIQREATAVPSTVYLNRYVYLTVDDFSDQGRPYAQWLFARLSAHEIGRDPAHLKDYAINKFIALPGYQCTGVIKNVAPAYAVTSQELARSVDRFAALLQDRLREVMRLKAKLTGAN
jgi:hypothetical protein